MQRKTILMTGGGAPGMPGILHCLRFANDARLRLVGADMNPQASCKHEFEAFYTIPRATDPKYTECLLEICQKEHVDLVLSCVTRELNVLAKNREKFETIGIRVAVMDIDTLEIVNNKGNLLTELKALGIATPRFRIAETWDEVKAYAEELGYPQKPFCVKAVVGNGSRAIRTIVPHAELANQFFENKPNGMICSYEDIENILKLRHPWPCKMMVMEYLQEPEYAVDILAKNGETLSIVVRKSENVFSSNQMQCIVEKNEYVESLCKSVVAKLRLSGNVGFDLRENEDGIPQIIECNPRLTGGIVACCAAGINLPYFGILSWLDEPIDIPPVNLGVRMNRRFEELFFDKDNNLITF